MTSIKDYFFSELIVSIMDGDDLSIRDLAKEANISKSVIQNLRSGKQHNIKVSNLIKIARAFGFQLILQKGQEKLLLDETSTKNSSSYLSVTAAT